MAYQGQSLGQVSRQRERAGSAVGHPVDLPEFLGAMGLGEYARILMDNEIDLEAVQLMADSDFQDIGARGFVLFLFLCLTYKYTSWVLLCSCVCVRLAACCALL